ncbi:peptidoglycan recognition protein family protein [Streptomyces europaeiscabiei]|uniref:N-acetylmuramoyl-L-alanine amidase n=1 Tax=Streptomyces europaeiscabiei TaxID=146819 RepID=A0ABU4NQS0_9ACTN|nr:N-acetylmuramoyl-L-alanine amidase [Streptomyces europaeiscabiei]MDX3555174.1 N-acetylmuramoyl-L-alanine amidase [Streptomyces europaeiscabiei]MDX3705188.1 N-acetylmuramoyl-L-alanine amidase [Streptomyces europaeiscabiei]MDX3864401.1 N-acetylmuramoyl-L-alanine amidase [Streptomyces europaeiscabiei]MDX3871517.1 N-acetylmuramoyl-L-alanine amidase [Streptomyces europaeiscabiei]
MAKPASAAAFLAALRAEGVDVVEEDGWKTHNRNHMGPWGPVHGVMIHHTVTSGSAKTVRICRDGYAGLPGPLCQGVITKAGRVHLVGYGRCNHAGSGDDDVLKAVIAEKATLPPPNETNTDGNRHFYGFECENLGDGQDPWPDEQAEAIVRVGSALCRYHGWTVRSVVRHLEWQYGKVDPRGLDWQDVEARITERLKHKASWNPGGTREYTVRSGDTLWSIAKQQLGNGSRYTEITELNGLKSDVLTPGQKLKLPAK